MVIFSTWAGKRFWTRWKSSHLLDMESLFSGSWGCYKGLFQLMPGKKAVG